MRATPYPGTIDLIVEEYLRDNVHRQAETEWWRAEGLSHELWLERIVEADLFGKRHPHQRRLGRNAIEHGKIALKPMIEKILIAPDFLELWFIVKKTFRPIYGLGELAVYDTADRMRHRLDLVSEHLIFLHAGARVGARRLLGGRLPRESGWAIQRWDVPQGLRHLPTHEIEDILCIYKDEFFLTPEEFLARRRVRSGCVGTQDIRVSC